MRPRQSLLTLLMALALHLIASPSFAQIADATKKPSVAETQLNVFLDCDRCDYSFILSKVNFVNYVRDRTAADLHLLITRESTGSGRRYSLNYIGLKRYTALRDTLVFNSSNTDTDDERRSGLNSVIKMGLVRYIARTDFADRLTIGYKKPSRDEIQLAAPRDNWNAWVFRISTNGSFQSEESRESARLRLRVSGNRVTDEWKIRTNLNGDYSRNRYDLSDTTIISSNQNGSIFNFTAKSLGEHWSIGSSTYLSTSSFNNTDLLISVAPAVEYSIFPYSQFNTREFRIEYRIGVRSYDYTEETIFDKYSEQLLYHEFETTFELRQPWGSSQISLDASQFLHDFSEWKQDFFRVEFGGSINVRVVRGLSVSFGGDVSWVKDQLSLPKVEASEEEILLGARSLPTAYEYGLSVGLSYTFGSIYNNVVNPRFGF